MNKTIYVKTTGTCNLNCQHCFTNGKNGDKTQFDPYKTTAWVKDFMSRYPSDTRYHMEFHGGEPFLVPVSKLKEYADQFVDNEQVTMGANSNLTFKLTDDIIEFIKTYLGSHVGTSWDNWIRWTSPRQVELWKNNLQTLTDNGISIGLMVSVSRPLLDMTPDWFLDQMEALPVESVSLERLTMDGSAQCNVGIFPDNEKQDNWYLALYTRYKERQGRVKIRTLDIIENKLKNNIVKVDTNCRNCEQNLVTISSNGSLSGCPNAATALSHATLESGVDEFLLSDGRLKEITRELTWHDNCLKCDVYDLCGGDCHRLPWQDGRCGGLKNTLRHLSGRNQHSNLILKV